ncbi:hypothetical protein OC834_000427 [Tilletia horrida]|nr:hypothetical protein OC834_000427 [Tilletia horrida]
MAPITVPSLLECWESRDLARFRVVLKGGKLEPDNKAAAAAASGVGGVHAAAGQQQQQQQQQGSSSFSAGASHGASTNAVPGSGTAGGGGLSGSLSTSAGGGGGGGPSSYARSPPGGHSISWGKSDGIIGPAPPAEVNRRDEFGRTALHLVCASTDGIAIDFLHALLSHPSLNVNLQDFESGYTALHRALYAGNLPTVLTLLRKADTDLRIKDFEGLTPFDLYNSTISGTNPKWTPEVGGSELFTWGVNRNFTLGLGDGDDRSLPRLVALNKVYDEYALANLEPGARYDRLRIRDVAMSKLHTVVLTTERSGNVWICGFGGYSRLGRANQSQTCLEPLKDFHDCAASVAVAQDHTIIVTTNGDVYTFGQNRFTQLGYVLEKGQGLVGSTTGGVGRGGGAPTATFVGTSAGPQLGGSLGTGSGQNQPAELDLQVSPRKVAGVLKKEFVKGAAASKIHSAVFTADALYTWGTNTGQLGYDRTATPVQVYPRKVTSITAAQQIKQIAATEFATACLLETEDVIVLHNDGQFRLQFPPTLTARLTAANEVFTPRKAQRNIRVAKITSSGTTFAALSDMGDLFTFSLDHPSEYVKSGGNNVKPAVTTIWSVRRKFTAVRDVAIGGEGSIILSTESGHVYVRERRVGGEKGAITGKSKTSTGSGGSGKSAFKFQQIPYLQRVVKVATNESGGWAAIKADAPLRDIKVRGRSIEEDLQSLLPHLKVRDISRHGFEEEREIAVDVIEAERLAASASAAGEDDEDSSGDESDGEDHVSHRHARVGKLLAEAIRRWELADGSQRDAYGPNNLVPPFGCDMFVIADGRYIPAHRIVFAVRVPTLREALADPSSAAARRLPADAVQVRQVSDTVATLTLPKCSFATAIFLLHYLYTNDLPAVWTTSIGLQVAPQYHASKVSLPSIQSEMLELVQVLGLPDSVRVCLVSPNPRTPPSTLRKDMEMLFNTQVAINVTASPLRDTELLLSDRTVPCHSVILRRSPFYSDFFRPQWTSKRFEKGRIQINMRHLRWEVARLLLLHLYTDGGLELFKGADEDRTPDQFIDFVLEVLAAADEWALAKMKQVCSLLLRRRVLPQNLSAMMTDADTYSAVELKDACMLQATQTMESLLETGMLDELEGKQLRDLTHFVRRKQDERIHRSLAADRVMAMIVANQEEYDKIVQELKRPKPRPRKASVSSHNIPTSPELRPQKSHASSGPSKYHDDSLIFEMEEDDEIPSRLASPSLTALSSINISSMPAWAPLPKAVRSTSQTHSQTPPVAASPFGRSPPSAGPAKAPMTWASRPQAAEPSTSSGPTDLRSIMESEKARRPLATVVQSPQHQQQQQSQQQPVSVAVNSWRQPSSGNASLAGSGAATPQAPSSPSLLPVNFASAKLSQKDRRKQALLQNQRQSSSGPAAPTAVPSAALRNVGTSYSAISGGGPAMSTTPTGSPWKAQHVTPTPPNPTSPLASRSRDSGALPMAAPSAAASSGGAPWKSPPPGGPLQLPPSGSLPKAREASTSGSSADAFPAVGSLPRTPSKFSFAQIQEQQQQDLELDMRRASVKKSFAEIVEEERRIEEEERVRRAEAAEFERWFEQESRRVQESQPPGQAPGTSSSPAAKGRSEKEGRSKRGAGGGGGGGGAAGRGRSKSGGGGSNGTNNQRGGNAPATGTRREGSSEPGPGPIGGESADAASFSAAQGAPSQGQPQLQAQQQGKHSSRGRGRGGRGGGGGGRGRGGRGSHGGGGGGVSGSNSAEPSQSLAS